MSNPTGARLIVTGLVQGVGFRPFIYNLAKQLNIRGWVRNTSDGVEICIDADQDTLETFIARIKEDSPPLSVINAIKVESCPRFNFSLFEIVPSKSVPNSIQPVSPDICICEECLRELYDPSDRRFQYPFINCTNCGPRFTIIKDLPYDRHMTTMEGFKLCSDCAREYSDPTDRRFHAQPVACPVCGPHVWLESKDAQNRLLAASEGTFAIIAMQELLLSGQIGAIKGLGGFHLACDAENPFALEKLRQRKLRIDKPFEIGRAHV